MPFSRFAILVGSVLVAGAATVGLVALTGPQGFALAGVGALLAALLVRRRG
ncbi:hypothetical protein [Gemmobacter sp.]|uniref:hypothetical protein n=1 Tax=Gemmobacter sp. TaxID=1898957 RepID=UPI002AFDE072|nr:hypothetical protein [Gemmobacter sp.]